MMPARKSSAMSARLELKDKREAEVNDVVPSRVSNEHEAASAMHYGAVNEELRIHCQRCISDRSKREPRSSGMDSHSA
jgi:hypothetical protein